MFLAIGSFNQQKSYQGNFDVKEILEFAKRDGLWGNITITKTTNNGLEVYIFDADENLLISKVEPFKHQSPPHYFGL